YRTAAATVLAEYAADNPDLLAALVLDAEPNQFVILKPALEAQRGPAVARLRQALPQPGGQGPVMPVEERGPLARKHAQAGVTLLHLGDAASVWPLLRHSPEPEARSQLLARLGTYKVDPGLLVQRLDEEKDDAARAALIVGLGEFTAAELSAGVRGPLTEKLLRWYRDDPDPSVHGAIDWLLPHGQEGPDDRRLDWSRAREREEIDTQLKRRDPNGVRRWYVNKQGQTMVLLPLPVDGDRVFLMGSPDDEPGRRGHERQHVRRIDRDFAIASKAVTVEQWQRF